MGSRIRNCLESKRITMSDQNSSPALPSGRPVTALVADDTQSGRDDLRAMIAAYDPSIAVIEADSGAVAAQILLRIKPDIAFVNIQLPGLSGAEALAQAVAAGVKPFTILFSNIVMPHWVAVSQTVGAYEFLKKPFDPEHIANLLKSAERIRAPIKLLLVDGAPGARLLVRRVLGESTFRCEIEETDSGGHAVKMLRHGRYDVALIEWSLPTGIDGLETVCQASEAAADTKFVMMSGADIGAFAQTVKQFGVVAMLKKPFYAHDIDVLMHNVFDLRRPYLLNALLPVRQAGAAAKPAARG